MGDAKPPGIDADEKTTLVGFLDYLRHSVATKVDGAPEPQARTPGVPSGTSLLGLLKHLTAVERFYFLGENVRSWSATMKPTRAETVEELLAGHLDILREQIDGAVGR